MWADMFQISMWYVISTSTNKTDRHDKTEILLKVALNTINQTDVVFIGRSKEYLSTAGHQVPYIPLILEYEIYSLLKTLQWLWNVEQQ
jgi:hypothetical protein